MLVSVVRHLRGVGWGLDVVGHDKVVVQNEDQRGSGKFSHSFMCGLSEWFHVKTAKLVCWSGYFRLWFSRILVHGRANLTMRSRFRRRRVRRKVEKRNCCWVCWGCWRFHYHGIQESWLSKALMWMSLWPCNILASLCHQGEEICGWRGWPDRMDVRVRRCLLPTVRLRQDGCMSGCERRKAVVNSELQLMCRISCKRVVLARNTVRVM